jgi:hypothetical protein
VGTVRERDPGLERQLTDLAALAAGYRKPGPVGRLVADDHGLRDYADHRTHPGPLRTPRDWDQEAREEMADCANYLVWGLVEDYDGYVAGEPVATARFERRLRALVKQVESWRDLHTEAH